MFGFKKDIETIIRDQISNAIQGEVEFTVERPSDKSNGDYSTNVALVMSKKVNKNPMDLAEDIKEKINLDDVERIEVASPGFINFYLSRKYFTDKIRNIDKKYGRANTLKKERILIEYTSPNLFKPLHVGNLVGNIVGESMSRIFEYCGASVKRINYPSDIGLTVAKAVWGIQKTGGDASNIDGVGHAYVLGNKEYEKDKNEIEKVNELIYSGEDKSINEIRQKGIETSNTHINNLLSKLGTEFDYQIFESQTGEVGKRLVLDNKGDLFIEDAGAIIFKGEDYGLHTRVFINSKGLPTYEAKDIGNFVLKNKKFSRWTKSFVVTGGEQREYFKVLIFVIKKLFSLEDKEVAHIPTGFLTLSTGKMSSREGNVLTGEEIFKDLEENATRYAKESRSDDVLKLSTQIATAALKYQVLKQSVGSDITFDKEKALSFEGDSGPYLQYTYARINSILSKAKEESINMGYSHIPEEAYLVEKLVCKFEDVVLASEKHRSPHILVNYLTELAGEFNSFYAKERIVDKSDIYSPYKILVAKAIQITIGNGLYLLGIEAPEKM